MTLDISDALREGFDRLVSRTGAQLTLGYLAVYLVYQFAFNTLLAPFVTDLYAGMDVEAPAGAVGPGLGVSPAVAGAIVAASLVALSWLTVVAVRTFVAGNRDAFGAGHLTDGVVGAVVNLFAGGLVLLVLLWMWFLPVGVAVALDLSTGAVVLTALASVLLAILGGAFVFVSFVFMTMYIAAEGEHFVAAMRDSWSLASGERVTIFGLVVVVVALSFAIGIPVGIVQTAVTLTVGQGAGQVLNVVAIAPASMFNLAVLSVAFEQLRGEGDGPADGRAAPDAPMSPA